jgi:20S proteasome subunit beta 3
VQDFIVSGTASEKLFGMAESLWEPDLAPDDLFETISQTLLNAVDRDAYSGWGAVVYMIEKVRLAFPDCCTSVERLISMRIIRTR